MDKATSIVIVGAGVFGASSESPDALVAAGGRCTQLTRLAALKSRVASCSTWLHQRRLLGSVPLPFQAFRRYRHFQSDPDAVSREVILGGNALTTTGLTRYKDPLYAKVWFY